VHVKQFDSPTATVSPQGSCKVLSIRRPIQCAEDRIVIGLPQGIQQFAIRIEQHQTALCSIETARRNPGAVR
jgi:hypothetical protein